MRGVLAVDEAFCLISHYPRDSHAPHSASRPGAGRRAGGRGGGGRGRVSWMHRRVFRRRTPASASRSSARRPRGAARAREAGPRVSRDATRATHPVRGRPARSEEDRPRPGALGSRAAGTPIAVRVPHVRLCERRHRKIKDIYEINSSCETKRERRNHERQIIIQQTSFSRGAAGAGVCMRASGNACERGPRTYGSVYC